MSETQIENLKNVFFLDPDTTIVGYKMERLLAAGENFGSLIFRLDITVKTPESTEEIQTVAKVIPPSAVFQKIFNTQETFRNEIAFYKHIIPTLEQFQQQQGVQEVVNFSARFYGGRINLEDNLSGVVDSNAVLLLENLKAVGYRSLDRLEGVNFDVAKLILKDLAELHAVPLAIKLKNPQLFKEKIKKYLKTFPFGEHFKNDIEGFREKLQKIPDCKLLIGRVLQSLKTVVDMTPREPFATVTHNDVWVNNTMVKFEVAVPVKTKIVDFQVCDYGSPAKDLLFFLFSSVKDSVIEEHYNDLLNLYHDVFTKTLQELQCDTAPFSLDALKKEIDFEARNSQFFHTVMMLVPIFAPKGTMKELKEFTFEDLKKSESAVSEEYMNKLRFIVKQYAKRKWI